MNNKLTLLGKNITGSLSPIIHNYWFDRYNIEASYDITNVENISNSIGYLRDNYLGANITMPLKEQILDFIDIFDEEAKNIGSINTIKIINGKIYGYNTDIYGFSKYFSNDDFNNKKILLIGAGGAARSIIYYFKKYQNISHLTVLNRSKGRLKNFIIDIDYEDFKYIDDKIAQHDIIINATSLGMINREDLAIKEQDFIGKMFIDIVYNPYETNFLKIAKRNNAIIKHGLPMFMHQAAKSFNIWFNINPEIDENIQDILKSEVC